MSESKNQDLLLDAKNFCDGLSNELLMRDLNTKHLWAAKFFIENLISEYQHARSNITSPSRRPKPVGGMGQLWVELDELKRKNKELQKQVDRLSNNPPNITFDHSNDPQIMPVTDYIKTKRENETLKANEERLETRIREMEDMALSVQDEYKRAKVALETTQKSMETVLKDYRQMEDELKLAKKENESLKQKYVYHYAKSSQ